MIKLIVENTDRFMNAVPKAKRKKYGQFFTNVTTALYMASLFDFDLAKPRISLLDAGAGTGILSAAAVQRLVDVGYTGHIHITCYETDSLVLPLLEENLKIIANQADVSFTIMVSCKTDSPSNTLSRLSNKCMSVITQLLNRYSLNFLKYAPEVQDLGTIYTSS